MDDTTVSHTQLLHSLYSFVSIGVRQQHSACVRRNAGGNGAMTTAVATKSSTSDELGRRASMTYPGQTTPVAYSYTARGQL
ncbi:MAG TPA: hypothetical protein VMM78_11915, partial [Thermomicrobiales bacterium]|nr:hypothetical protein [Thermomicrobiales bacterium]